MTAQSFKNALARKIRQELDRADQISRDAAGAPLRQFYAGRADAFAEVLLLLGDDL